MLRDILILDVIIMNIGGERTEYSSRKSIKAAKDGKNLSSSSEGRQIFSADHLPQQSSFSFKVQRPQSLELL